MLGWQVIEERGRGGGLHGIRGCGEEGLEGGRGVGGTEMEKNGKESESEGQRWRKMGRRRKRNSKREIAGEARGSGETQNQMMETLTDIVPFSDRV